MGSSCYEKPTLAYCIYGLILHVICGEVRGCSELLGVDILRVAVEKLVGLVFQSRCSANL